jgi:hypothetical protein
MASIMCSADENFFSMTGSAEALMVAAAWWARFCFFLRHDRKMSTAMSMARTRTPPMTPPITTRLWLLLPSWLGNVGSVTESVVLGEGA